ncbi:hypothetical protein MMC07_004886 [Pseudocyphellaria aurata]|nr:hypothetical protein [Pseudocyphellaria aurata]
MRIDYVLFLLLSFKKPIIASAHLVERQPQNLWPDWSLWDLGTGVVEGVTDTLTYLRGILGPSQGQQQLEPPKTTPSPDADHNSDRQAPPAPNVVPASPLSPDTSELPDPVYKIEINNNPSPLPDPGPNRILPAVVPSVNEECDPNQINNPDCGKTTDQLIFTSSCAGINPNQIVSVEAMAQNQAIRDALVVMNGENILAGKGGRGLRVSTLYLCDVFFFAVPLTQGQIVEIEKKPNVRFIKPNRVIIDTEFVPESSDQEGGDSAQPPLFSVPGSRLQERDPIIHDPDAWEDLRFISTPDGSDLSSTYSFYSEAGQGTTVIAVDRGFNEFHDEFMTETGESSLLGDRIYALDTSELPDADDHFGTCHTSKIVGSTCGVARKAKVLFAKVSPEVGSLIDVMVQVANYLNARVRSGEIVAGYYVMSVMTQWDNDDWEVAALFEEILRLLMGNFQLVVVVPAGDDQNYKNSDIIKWPASAERRFEIIVVGAIDIRTERAYTFSRGGPFLSILAPGMVRCARNQAGKLYLKTRGTKSAAAQVAGLAAYFLSLDDIGMTLRRTTNIPQKVKLFIKIIASKRTSGNFPAIWNRIGGIS